MTPDFLRELYPVLRTAFDFIVVDTPPGFTPEVIATIDSATAICMVGMLDAPSLKNTRLGLETLGLMGVPSDKVKIVLNRADTNVGISHADVVERARARAGHARAEQPRHRALDQQGRADRARGASARRPRRRSARSPTSTPRARSTGAAADGRRQAPPRAVVMELRERIARANTAREDEDRRDIFAEVKDRVHAALIADLGPQLFNAEVDGQALRSRITRRDPRARRPGARPVAAPIASASSTRSSTTRSATARSSGCWPTTP